MRNLFKLFGLTALIAVIVFSVTACPGDGGGGGGGGGYANVKVKSKNNGGNISNVRSAARAAGDVSDEYGTDATSFAPLTGENGFYSKLGAKKTGTGYNITPTVFKMAVGGVTFFASNGDSIHADLGVLDLVNGTTITVNDVPEGVTCTAIAFTFSTGVQGPTPETSGWGTVEFEWVGGESDFNSHSKKAFYGQSVPALPWGGGPFAPSWNGNKVTILMDKLLPSSVQLEFGITGQALNIFSYIAYNSADTQRRYANTTVLGGHNIGSFGCVYIPFTPVTVSGTVTFTMSWDLTGIIEVYENGVGSANDVYVLKNGFWDGLYMAINIRKSVSAVFSTEPQCGEGSPLD